MNMALNNFDLVPFKLLRTAFNINQKLTITTDKRLLTKDMIRKDMSGKPVKFKRIFNEAKQLVSVEYMGNMFPIPLTTVLGFEDKTIVSEATSADTVFAVIAQHGAFKVGDVFETTVFKEYGTLYYYHGKEKVQLNTHCVKALSAPISNKAKAEASLERLGSKFNIKASQEKPSHPALKQVVKVVEEKQKEEVIQETLVVAVEPVVLEEPLVKATPKVDKPVEVTSNTPAYKSSICDFVHIPENPFSVINSEIEAEINNLDGEYTDMTGKTHKDLVSCLKANQYFIDMLYLNTANHVIAKALK